MANLSTTDRLAKRILGQALDRQLDGQQDRLASVVLSLLLDPSTHAIGQSLVQAFLDPKRRWEKKNQIHLAYPVETIAMVAEAQFPHRRADLLWEAIPHDRRRSVMTKILCYAVMNEDPSWVRVCAKAIQIEAKADGFDRLGMAYDCSAIVKDIMSLHGQTVPDEVIASTCWKVTLPLLLQHIIAVYDDQFAPQCEWIIHHMKGGKINLPLAVATQFSGLDPELYPGLTRAGAQVRRDSLWKTGLKLAKRKPGMASRL